MSSAFHHDVFLSNSLKDKAVVCFLTEQFWQDRLKVWFDEWVLKHSHSISAKIEEGPEQSRVQELCMSASKFSLDPDWSGLKSGTYRFLNPLNKERRFIPLRLDRTFIQDQVTRLVDWPYP